MKTVDFRFFVDKSSTSRWRSGSGPRSPTSGRGKPAPGRTVVRLTLTDPDGREVDESGLYVVEDGRASIPLRFAADDPTGGMFSKWRASVTDLTTGEEVTLGYRRVGGK